VDLGKTIRTGPAALDVSVAVSDFTTFAARLPVVN